MVYVDMQIPAGAELGIPCYEGSVAFDFMMGDSIRFIPSHHVVYVLPTYVSVGSPPGFDRQNFSAETRKRQNAETSVERTLQHELPLHYPTYYPTRP